MTRRSAHAEPAPPGAAPRRRPARRAHGLGTRAAVLLAAVLGVAVLVYPNATQWLSAQAQGSGLSVYSDRVAETPDTEQQQLLQRAHDYNAGLPLGQLQDPYSSPAASGSDAEAATADYLSQLKVPGTDIMARVQLPSIDAYLPIRHGTAHTALDQGAGHLYGSSLPVGGAGTHAVLAAHSGLTNAKMLTNLQKVHLGDVFTVDVLGETLYYEVDKISVVKPDDLHDLTIEQGKDYVTLVTCTPINVNTHRLLVRGTRIDAPHEASGPTTLGPAVAGFPYWALVLGFAVVAAIVLTFLPARRKRPRDESPGDGTVGPNAAR